MNEMTEMQILIAELTQFADYVGLTTCYNFEEEETNQIYEWSDPNDSDRYVLLFADEETDELAINFSNGETTGFDPISDWDCIETWSDYFERM